jgi:hypothetical protein
VSKQEWDSLSPLNKMKSAIQLAGYHYITCLKAMAGNENCELEIKGTNYCFENIRTHDWSTLAWEFQSWAARSVLRDLVESFSIFMTEVFQSIESKSSKQLTVNSVKFERLGIEEQSQVFKVNFNVDDQWFLMFDGLNRVRNCLAHRQGIVSAKDLNDNGNLTVSWLKTIWSIADRTHSQFVEAAGLYNNLVRGEQATGSLAIDLGVDRVEKRFDMGKSLIFEPDEILQICMTFSTLASVFSRVEE